MPSSRPARIVFLGAALFLLSGCARALPLQPPSPWPLPDEAAVEREIRDWKKGRSPRVSVLHPEMQASIERLRQSSPSFESAWEMMEKSGISILIGTDRQLARLLPYDRRYSRYWSGLFVPIPNVIQEVRLRRAMVVIRLDWLHQVNLRFGPDPEYYKNLLDDLLIHEIYGHMAPVVEKGRVFPGCYDAVIGQPRETACVEVRSRVIQRERAEFLKSTGAAALW